jgi:hypothetical protein
MVFLEAFINRKSRMLGFGLDADDSMPERDPRPPWKYDDRRKPQSRVVLRERRGPYVLRDGPTI